LTERQHGLIVRQHGLIVRQHGSTVVSTPPTTSESSARVRAFGALGKDRERRERGVFFMFGDARFARNRGHDSAWFLATLWNQAVLLEIRRVLVRGHRGELAIDRGTAKRR
jgi:hypothetical protein